MSDTPEGKTAGLVKNKAMSQLVTNGSDHYSMMELLKNMNILGFDKFPNLSLDESIFFDLTKVFLDGVPIGATKFAENIQNELLTLRRSLAINYEVSISFNKKENELYIVTDAGRTCRPLLIVKNGSLLLKKHHIEEIKKGYWDEPPGNAWTKLLERGFVEIIDKQEEEHTLIAMFPDDIDTHPNKHLLTHCELQPALAFGVGVNMIPFPDHNQCIFEDELVFMTNGTLKKIKDVIIGDSVINFDPKTQRQTNTLVVGNYSSPTNKKIYEITTLSGRKIKATYDHQFMTDVGWIRLEYIPPFMENDIIANVMVAISLEPTAFFHNDDIIAENIVKFYPEYIKNIFSKVGIDESFLSGYGNSLVFDDCFIVNRSRILGYAFSSKSKIVIDDGLMFTAKFNHINDAMSFNEDLKLLGYFSSNILQQDSYFLLRNRDLSLILFLIICGVEVLGFETPKEYFKIPDFVKNGSPLIKREFLAGYQGGQSSCVLCDVMRFIVVFKFPEVLVLSSKNHYAQNQKFINDLMDLFSFFGIIISKNTVTLSGVVWCFSYMIDNDSSNIVKYIDTVGYRYNRKNTLELGIASEFLKSKKLGYFKDSFEKWKKIIKSSPEGISLYLPIYKKVLITDTNLISDITTLSSHQSFLCGDGYCVHNSPRNTYQCIYREENVLMADGTIKKIKDLVVGNEIKTFDPKTRNLTNTFVTFTQNLKTKKNILEITTKYTKIILTDDHKIFTPLWGWIESRFLKVGESVYESAGYLLISTEIVNIRELLDEEYTNVCDISVSSDTQSFICGSMIYNESTSIFRGICVHNSSMGKQAIGLPGSNYMFKRKGATHVLNYQQRPLVSSKMSRIMGFQHQPYGLNAIVFVGPYLGYNQEDSLILNKDSIDRGFMSSTAYLPFDAKIRKDKGELFEVPDESGCSNYSGNISKLDPLTGFVREGEIVSEGDILIGKTVTIDEESSIYHKAKKNLSIKYDQDWEGIVHSVQSGIDGQGYDYVRIVIAQERYPIEGDKFCYTPDHDVLTDKGWIDIPHLTLDHKIATLNPNHEIEYHYPTDLQMFNHEGEMVEVDTNQVSLCVTPNHKMYVRRRSHTKLPKEYKMEEAKDLHNIHVHYKKDGKNINKGLEYFTLSEYLHIKKIGKDIYFSEKKLPINEWLVFYGIWYAEGCVSSNKLTIAVNKQRVKDALVRVLPKLNFEYTILSNDVTLNIIKNPQLRKYMEPLSVGAIHKQLEDWVWELSEEQSRILLESMCLGDGHSNKNTPMYDTSSEKLKDDVMRLALHCGWSANAYVKQPCGVQKEIQNRNTVTHADAWRITIIKTQNEPVVNKHIKNQQRSINYSGKVYCCTVPNHILYVRRTVSVENKIVHKKHTDDPETIVFDKRLQKPVWSCNSGTAGQKGTAGKLVRSHELPFNKYGIPPDIMMNPLALPSRMTIGMMIELLCGKLVCSTSNLHKVTVDRVFRLDRSSFEYNNPEDKKCEYSNLYDKEEEYESSSEYLLTEGTNEELEDGELLIDKKDDYKKFVSTYNERVDENLIRGQDASPWQSSFSVEWVCEELKKLGINEFSSERMTYGKSGEVQEFLTFEGVCYYQRLKHMVVDKHHSRSRGSKIRLTHQPTEGRKIGGGFRINRCN